MTKKIKDLINEQIAQSFIQEYRNKATDQEGLGLLVSHYFEWCGDLIIETFCEALEDANFHTFRQEVLDLAKKHNIIK